MNGEHINGELDVISQELISIDPENLQDLGRLYESFENLARSAASAGHERLQDACHGAIELIKTMMLDESGQRCVTLEVLNQTVSAMQQLLRPGADPGSVLFPDQLPLTQPRAESAKFGELRLPAHLDAEIFNEFLAEKGPVLDSIEKMLLDLERSFDQDVLADLRRVFHTLKGEAGVFELTAIERCCHLTEDMMEGATSLPIDTLLSVKDWLHSAFDLLRSGRPEPELDLSLFESREAGSGASGTAAGEADQAEGTGGSFHLPEHLDEDLFNEFVDDQGSVLENMEACLLAIESGQHGDNVADVRRMLHTMKGETGIFGLSDVERVCHAAEDAIEAAGDDFPTDKLLAVMDWLKTVYDALRHRNLVPAFDLQVLKASAPPAASPPRLAEEESTAAPAAEQADEDGMVFINRNVIRPAEKKPQQEQAVPISADLDLLSDFISEVKEHIDTIDNRLLSLENNPDDQDLLNAVFRVFHTIKGAAGFLALDDIARLAHTTENLLDLARKGEIVLAGVRVDVIFEAVDEMKKLVGGIEQSISNGLTEYPSDPHLEELVAKIQHVLDHRNDGSPPGPSGENRSAAPDAPAGDEPEPPAIVERPAGDAAQELPVPETAAPPSGSAGKAQQVKIKESIKVDSENLDKLIDAIGELVIIESMIRQDGFVRQVTTPGLLRNITQMNKITRELQQLGMSLRMIPVKATFQKMARVVRDLSKKSGKKISFLTHGEDTMLDKSVVDRIGDPLIHLVRNSVDHGIEATPADRVTCGKEETGTVELTSFHKGGNIYIEIRDDGRGLNRDAILKKAREKGLVRENQNLTDREIFNLIFLPGFSTAKTVTDVSGRGVGMDVVKRTIEDLRGNIEIFSEAGKGSVFSLRLPLTLAIIDGMLVGVGTEKYIIPTLSIVESIRPRREDLSTIVNQGEMIRVRDDLIPLFRLSRLFHLKEATQDPCEGIVIVVEDSGKMTGLLVDVLLGQQSTVIKSLGAAMKGLPGISGGSILSDGRVGIILDIAGIVKLATAKNNVVKENTAAETP